MGKLGSDVEKFIQDPPRLHHLGLTMSKNGRGGKVGGGGTSVCQLGLTALLVSFFWFAMFGFMGCFSGGSYNYKENISCAPSGPGAGAVEKVMAPGQDGHLLFSSSSNFSPPLPPPPPQSPQSPNEMPISIQQSQFVFAAVVTEIKTDDGTLLSYSSSNNVETLDAESVKKIDDTPSAAAPSHNGAADNDNDAALTQPGQVYPELIPPAGQMDQVESGGQQQSQQQQTDVELGQVFLALNQLDEQATSEIPKYLVALPGVKMNWFEALQACLFEKMQLVAIETEEKWKEIERLVTENLDSATATDDFWTSGTNLWTDKRDKFFWASTGMALNYTNWHANNPSLADGQNCIEITKTLDPTNASLRWNDYGCHTESRFICEQI